MTGGDAPTFRELVVGTLLWLAIAVLYLYVKLASPEQP